MFCFFISLSLCLNSLCYGKCITRKIKNGVNKLFSLVNKLLLKETVKISNLTTSVLVFCYFQLEWSQPPGVTVEFVTSVKVVVSE